MHTREGGPTVQLCGDSNVACKWINGEYVQGTKYTDTIGKVHRILHSWWKRGAATQISIIDNFVKQIYREQTTGLTLAPKDEEKLMCIGRGPSNMESDTRFLGWKLQRRRQERLRNRD